MRCWLMLLCGTSVAAAQTGGLLAVVNQKEHSVVLVDAAARKPVASVSVGVNGHEIAASADGKMLYVPIYGNSGVGKPGTDGSTIDVIDVASRKVAKTIDLGRPLRPHKPLLGRDGMLYCTTELANAISILDPKTGVAVGQIPTGAKESHMLALSPDGRRGYTANVGAGSVSVLDIAGRKLVTVIPLTKTVQRITVSNDGRWVITSDYDHPRIAVIDAKTDALSRWVATGARPYVTQQTQDGRYLLVSEIPDTEDRTKAGQLEVLEMATWKVVHTYPLPAAGTGGFLLHGGLIYLSVPAAGVIEVLDPETWTMQPEIRLTPGVDGLAWTRAWAR
jgi:DNA-binding beta-propeller fold protein YncE